ncbi:MAG: hypothetical protein M3Z22_08735 [Verrucomicrobiota bacterium]|nr:hypothetical protein [Verrucomicrobiota bacterium]
MNSTKVSIETRRFEVAAKRAQGPYPAVKRRDHKDEVEATLRKIPTSRKPLPLREPAPATKLMDIRGAAGDPREDPVIFYTYTTPSKVGPKNSATNAADISGADSEAGVVLMTGNWYCDYSVDGGATFTSVDPTTVFKAWPKHDFCCDQVIIYVQRIDRFIWFLQHDADSDGIGAFRLAVASPADIKTKFETAWTYWEFTAATFALSEDMDYPDMAFTSQFLHVSTDATTTGGRLVARFALSDIAAGGTLPGSHNHPDKTKDAVGAHLVEDSSDGAFWVGEPDNSSFNIYSWPDSSTTVTPFKVGVAAWPNGALSSLGPNNNDWLQYLSGHVPQNKVCGATRSGDQLFLAWTAASGSGTGSGFNFPNAHVRVAVVDAIKQTLVSETQIWNKDYAFAYPSLSVNAKGDVAIATGVGGPNNHAHTSFGILGDHVVWHADEGDYTPQRWGDFITVRRNQRNRSKFAGFGYFTTKVSGNTGQYFLNPFYVVFGRKSLGP